jgi:hypothetical protein
LRVKPWDMLVSHAVAIGNLHGTKSINKSI